MAKYTDAIRDAIIASFNAGDQPTEAQFTNWITRIQEGIEEHDHSGTGDGDGTGTLEGPITLIDATLNSAATFYGLRAEYIKTAGAGGAGDDYYGIRSVMRLNQATTIDNLYAGNFVGILTLGTADIVQGLLMIAQIDGGTVDVGVRGLSATADINAGTINGSVTGLLISVDIEAAAVCNAPNYGLYLLMDDEDDTSTSYMIYLAEQDNIDYAIFQAGGTAPSVLTGDLTLSILGGGGNQDVGADNVGKLYVPFVSDRKFKNNIEPLIGGLEAVRQMRAVTFNWNPEELAKVGLDFGKCGQQVGLIAQEVVEAIPLAANRGEQYESYRKDAITPYLIEAIKELDIRLTQGGL